MLWVCQSGKLLFEQLLYFSLALTCFESIESDEAH